MQLNVFEESEKRQQQCFKQMIEVKHKNDIAEEEKDTQFFMELSKVLSKQHFLTKTILL